MKTWQKILLGGIITAVVGYSIIYYLHHNYERFFTVEIGDTVIDVGAHRGTFTLPASEKAGLIIAIEPSSENAEYLRNRNKENVVVIQKAVWNENISKELCLTLRDDMYNLISQGCKTHEPIEAETLDDIISSLEINHIDFIKMDIEGAELEALEGMKYTLSITDKIAIASYHIRDGEPTYNRVMSILRDNGFNVYGSLLIPNILGIVYGIRGIDALRLPQTHRW